MAKLEYLGQPATLFRYRSLNGGTAKIDQELMALEKRFIWAGSFDRLNDPMEGQFDKSRKLKKRGILYSAEVQSSIANVGIASFCEIENHVLMWAHYSDQFQGLCIAYDFRELIRNMADDVMFTRISYSDSAALLTRVLTDTATVAKRVLSRKTRAWLYEREWRMFSEKQGQQNYRVQACVRRVLLGHKMPRDVRDIVEARLKSARVAFKEIDKRGLAMSL